MATLPDVPRAGAGSAQPADSVLHMEMQSGERRLLTLFESSFLKWINDEAAGSFAGDVGPPASISLDESNRDAQMATLHLTLTWRRSTEALATRLVADRPTPSHAPETVAPLETAPSVLFTYDSQVPVFEQSTPAADLTTMMATLLERSERLWRSTRARHVPVWIPARLVAVTARGTDVLARWTDAAIESTDTVLDRSRRRIRQVAALWHSARLGSVAHAQSVVHVLRTRSSVGITPMSWAAAGLFAASVIYVGWLFARPATGPVAAAAANPSATQTATVMPPQPGKSPARVGDPRPTAMARLRTSDVVQTARAIPSASANSGGATASATRAKPARQTRGYVGSLVITSEPQGADVSLDGVPQGRTPLAIRNLNVGSRVVRLDLPGHQRWSWAVSVVANRRTPIAVRLLRAMPARVAPRVGTGHASATGAKTF